MSIKKSILVFTSAVLALSCSLTKTASKKTAAPETASQTTTPKGDSTKNALKPYKEIITDKAISQNGLFKVHKVNERYFFEIPDSLLNRDMLLVNRIIKGSVTRGLGGDWIGENQIQFSRSSTNNNKLFIQWMNHVVRSGDSTANGMYQAVQNSTMQPYVSAFDVKAISPDSAGLVIDMTDYLNTDNDIFFFNSITKKNMTLGPYQADRSYITTIRSFPMNLEIKTVKTYAAAEAYTAYSFELNSSLILLPKDPMKPRYDDKRVGYFSWGYWNYDASQPAQETRIITRWRLEPKDEDITKYQQGELVEPKKPIVFYIDPATPKKWVSYLIQGVNDWQAAFEKAGFKKAIYALEAPVDDSTWSLEDARHSAIVYKASTFANASGPQVSDPRSGEIVESHINWYHSVQKLVHDWYMIQAAPNDPRARKMQFDDSLMGQLIRFICAHEVGHTLGLQHNFGASSTVPVDSLRSKRYVTANGYCPSIMDYARFNYVAQPEDGLDPKDLMPRIGSYDKWAIEWGYKWFADLGTKDEEKAFMNKWIISRVEKDKQLSFVNAIPDSRLEFNWDPKNQVEDLGDDAIKAGYYGIQNLKRIVPHLKEWTKEPNKDYQALEKMNMEVVYQYKRYLFHVAAIIGGRTWVQKNVEEDGEGVVYPDRARQKAAVQFLLDELFTTPKWFLDNEIYRLSVGAYVYDGDPGTMYRLFNLQAQVLLRISSYKTFGFLLSQQTTVPKNAYTTDELLADLENGIWKELNNKAPVNIYRRNLQKLYAEHLIRQANIVDKEDQGLIIFDRSFYSGIHIFTDGLATVKDHLRGLLKKINLALPGYTDKVSRVHLIEIRDRIKKALYNQTGILPSTTSTETNKNAFNLFELKQGLQLKTDLQPKNQIECWQEENDEDISEKQK